MEGSCKHITFGEEIDPTSYWRKLPPQDPLWESRGIKPSAVGVNVPRSLTATQSSLLRKLDTIRQDLTVVELEFRTIEDKMDFKAAYDALRRLTELDAFRRQNRPLPIEEKPPSEHQSPTEQGSLRKKYESAAVDAGNAIPTVMQKGDNTELTPFYKAKIEVGGFGPSPPYSPPALAEVASSRTAEAENAAAEGAAAAVAAAPPPPPKEKDKPLKFQDAIGRKYSFPFQLCNTWSVSGFLAATFAIRPNLLLGDGVLNQGSLPSRRGL